MNVTRFDTSTAQGRRLYANWIAANLAGHTTEIYDLSAYFDKDPFWKNIKIKRPDGIYETFDIFRPTVRGTSRLQWTLIALSCKCGVNVMFWMKAKKWCYCALNQDRIYKAEIADNYTEAVCRGLIYAYENVVSQRVPPA